MPTDPRFLRMAAESLQIDNDRLRADLRAMARDRDRWRARAEEAEQMVHKLRAAMREELGEGA